MKVNITKMSLLFILLTGVTASSFFLNDYLTKALSDNNYSKTQLAYGVANGNETALTFAWQQSSFHSDQWLTLAKKLANTSGEASYQLALYYQYSSDKMIFWLNNAIRLKYLPAYILLAKLYFDQDKHTQAREIIAQLPTQLPDKILVESIIIKANIALDQGETDTLGSLIREYSQLLSITEAGQKLVTDINKYQVLSYDTTSNKKTFSNLECQNSIQLFATTIKHLKRLEKLKITFQQQPINNAVCFSAIRYIPISSLECDESPSSAIRCNELGWHKLANTIKTRYIGVMLPRGGANVHFGILYFDAHDSVDVISHEISHLLGFVDEYPLISEHVKCLAPQKESFSLNIAVLKNRYQGDRRSIRTKILKQVAWANHIKESTPILQLVTELNGVQNWQLGTPKAYEQEVGMYLAKSCDNAQWKEEYSAYKGISQRTKLEYFALTYPKLYLDTLTEKNELYRMPSFHYNIALAFSRVNSQDIKNLSQVKFWLEQAISWEVDINRQKKVRQGVF